MLVLPMTAAKHCQLNLVFVDSAKSLADKYVSVMNSSLQGKTDVDDRQCIYYCAYGATMGMFEMLVAMLVNVTDKAAQTKIHATAQQILAMCVKVEETRKREATEFENAVKASGPVH